jgi:hypothetical protein
MAEFFIAAFDDGSSFIVNVEDIVYINYDEATRRACVKCRDISAPIVFNGTDADVVINTFYTLYTNILQMKGTTEDTGNERVNTP